MLTHNWISEAKEQKGEQSIKTENRQRMIQIETLGRLLSLPVIMLLKKT